MSRTKKRIKRLLKKALPLAALAGGAMLLGRRKGTAFPRPKVGNVKSIRPGVNTSFNPKSIIIKDGVRVPNPAKMEADRLNMMRAIRSTPRTTFDAPDFSDMDPLMLSSKNGGMIVKGEKKAVRTKKKKGIQVRGFGKARR